MRVLKFGGTSVANAERFQDVAKIALDTAVARRKPSVCDIGALV